ncbi:RHS repeat-associated core domain-containing protein [Pseudomonas silesiensis]|uniref:RHS repeat-associated core domain-containing protein n=1 Tax=Pseudomonas silesiensis TaxID=1853130 RepID=UPI0030D9FB3B
MTVAQWIDAHTPTLSVVDSRGLAVRNVGYHCHPLNPAFESRINRNQFDPAGRLVASWDPRLWGTAPKPNLASTFDLRGRPLLVDSVDAGWQLSLLDQADVTRSYWDGRGSQRHSEYDELLRPINVIEQMAGEVPRISDRFIYGTGSEEFVAGNQCGQLIRHKHPAGSRSLCEYGVGGFLLLEQTRFMHDLEPPDWSSEWADTHLEDEVFETSQRFGPSGEMRSQSDAMGNVRSFTYDQVGQLRDLRLKLAASAEESCLLVSDIHYDALGRSLSERAGNGVITIARYADDDGRLLQLKSYDVDGEALQDFNYGYDPIGNITHIEDSAQRTRYFNNQRIDPVCRYGYDSLYQLIEASGSEVSQPSHGPALPTWQTTPLDPNQLRNYTQSFEYDAAGNLQTRHHSGTETFEMFTSPASNRSVANKENLVDGFDANGNQLELLRGQKMSWDIRNQLSLVTLVVRDDGHDDTECYCYDSPGHRLRKVRLTQAEHRTLRAEVRYLPGVEIHLDATTGEERHVISVEAGRSQVRALHWAAKLPGDVRNDQLRFCLSNHLNSSTLELDEQGGVLSREVYYAFGGTALWAGASEIEAKYKTIRYSGKERDATGLYYYGYRYYAPWLQRWVSPDPAGNIAGLNFFAMVWNNPVVLFDSNGLAPPPLGDEEAATARELHFSEYLKPKILARRENDKSEALASIKKRLPNTDVKAANELLEGFSLVLGNGRPAINVKPDDLAGFRGTELINHWEKATSRGAHYSESRIKVENDMFEYESSSSSNVRSYNLPATQGFNSRIRPLYGLLEVFGDEKSEGVVDLYGGATLYFSDEKKKYMTLHAGDSNQNNALNKDLAVFENVYPLISKMDEEYFSNVHAFIEGRSNDINLHFYSDYVEFQLHSGLMFSEIDEVVFEGASKSTGQNSAGSFLSQYNIPFRYKK